MVETCCPHRSDIAEAALNLVGDRESGHEVTASAIRVFRCRQDRRQIIARMAGFTLGKIAVIEVEVSNQRAVVKGSSIRGGPPATN